VDDALVFAVHVEQAHAGFTAIPFKRFKLEFRVLIEDRERTIRGGHGVVHHCESKVRAADFATFGFEPCKGLRGSAFVDEVAIDVDERGFSGFFVDDVGVPDLLVQRFGRVIHCHGFSKGV